MFRLKLSLQHSNWSELLKAPVRLMLGGCFYFGELGMTKCKIYKTFEDWKSGENFVELSDVSDVYPKENNSWAIDSDNNVIVVPSSFIIEFDK